MFAIAIDRADCRARPAISFRQLQNSSSMLTVVLWPVMTIERFEAGA